MTPYLQTRGPIASVAGEPSSAGEAPASCADERALRAPTARADIGLTEATIAKLQRGAEARASDRARRARAVEAHGRSIETLLRSMRDLAGSAINTRLANADRRGLDYVFRALRRKVDAIAAQASVSGTSPWTRRAGDEDPAADVAFDARALGVERAHVLDVEGAIAAFEATELALGVVGFVRGELTMAFRASELEVDAVRAMRASLRAAGGRLGEAERRDGIADDVVRSMGTPAYKA